MGVPVVKVTKNSAGTGTIKPGSKGIVAIIAPSSGGTANQPEGVAKVSVATADFGGGVLVDAAAYIMSISGNPVVMVKGAGSTPGVAGAVTFVGLGTSVITATGTPTDDFNKLLFKVTLGGTIGTGPISFTYSLDNGLTTSAVQALGTANTYLIPGTGVTLNFGVGTLKTGDTATVACTGPRLTQSDISTALEALRVSSLPWETVLILGHDAIAATVTLVDTWLAAREAEGRYRSFIVGARARTVATETEAQYLTAMTTAFSGVTSIRGCVCTDVGDLISVVPGSGVTYQRSSALALAARVAKINYGVDPAYVADGPVPGFALSDARGNPNHHDENLYPGLDAISLVTLRSFDRRAGTFITNANVLSPAGSDFVWIQHCRTMNRACEITFDTLTTQLSKGINKNPKPGPNGEIYIAEEDAQRIEQLVNQNLTELRGQVSDLKFVLARTDNIGANGPVVVNGDVRVSALAYAKEFDVNASFVRTVQVPQ